jgi:hypothetical protein
MWIEVFRTGRHTDSSGNTATYSQADLSQIAHNYNSGLEKDSSTLAPIVKGHPKTDDPALGWVESLKVSGEKLLAKVKDLVPEFAEEIRAGRYKKVSIALYPGNLLRHIGFLGAMAPAVKGLQPVAFADKGDYVEYSAGVSHLETQIELLKQENNQLRATIAQIETVKQATEFAEFAEGLVLAGKITPHQASTLQAILHEVSQAKQFSESQPLTDMIKEFANNIAAMPVLSGEFAQNEAPASEDQFAGKNAPPDRLAIHRQALAIARENSNLSYEQALLQALNQ